MKPQLSIEAFADFCERKSAEEPYYFWSITECACAQYARHLGGKLQGRRKAFWFVINDVAAVEPHTFGALAARLRAVQ